MCVFDRSPPRKKAYLSNFIRHKFQSPVIIFKSIIRVKYNVNIGNFDAMEVHRTRHYTLLERETRFSSPFRSPGREVLDFVGMMENVNKTRMGRRRRPHEISEMDNLERK